MKIDVAIDTTSLVGDDLSKYWDNKYSGGVVGEDYNIYAIPEDANIVTKFNTTTQQIIEVENHYDGGGEWSGGVLHSNGYIYCAPFDNNKVLKIKTNHIRDEGNNLLKSTHHWLRSICISIPINSNISMFRIEPSTIVL